MTAGRDCLILVPARAGSTRVANKNLRPLGGRPLVAHVVAAAVASDAGRVIVSTNSDEIAAAARAAGAETPFRRPDALATATASSVAALLHALRWLRDEAGWWPAFVAFCPPTNPFTRSATIAGMVGRLRDDPAANSVITVTRPSVHPFSFAQMRPDGTLDTQPIVVAGRHANNVERSQDLPPFVQRAGNCAVTRTRFFTDTFGDALAPERSSHIQCYDTVACLGYEIPPEEAQDIDTPEDFAAAERLSAARGA